jgi:hypothetical protein
MAVEDLDEGTLALLVALGTVLVIGAVGKIACLVQLLERFDLLGHRVSFFILFLDNSECYIIKIDKEKGII